MSNSGKPIITDLPLFFYPKAEKQVLQYLMGQTDIKTTMRVYNHVDMERVKRELNRLKQWEQEQKSLQQNLHHFAVDLCENM